MAIGKLRGFSDELAQFVLPAAPVPVQLALGLRSLRLVDEDAELRRRFAYALNAAMLAKGWKAPDLAKAINRDASTATRWAKGDSIPSLFLVKPIAAALGVEPRFLFDPPPVPDYPLAEYLIPSDDPQRAADLARGAVELAHEDLEQEAAGRRAVAKSVASRRGKRSA